MLAVYIIAGILLLLLIISLIPADAVFTFAYEDKVNGLEFFIKYLFIKIKVLPPKPKKEKVGPDENKKKDKNESKQKKTVKSKAASVKKLYRLIKALSADIQKLITQLISKTFRIKSFILETRIGTEDPMYTGLAVGAANGFIYNLLGMIDRNMKLDKFSVTITPEWENQIFEGGVYVKIRTSIFNILRLAFMLIPLYFKFRRLAKTL